MAIYLQITGNIKLRGVTKAISDRPQLAVFVDGPGGNGKYMF